MNTDTLAPHAADRVAEGLRDRLHGMWSAVAPAWDRYADYADERGVDVTAAMLSATAPRSGERVVELACGAGGVGLAASPLVGPYGQVLLSDVAPEMTVGAARRVVERGLDNVQTAVLDLDDLDLPGSTFDVAVCREGLMFAVDPAQATREIARVLRSPGGRAAVAVWAAPERNPWLALVFEAVSAQLGMTLPPPGVPGPFSLCDPDQLRAHFVAAGFAVVEVTEVSSPIRDGSFEAWWTRTTSLAGMLKARLAALSDTELEELTRRVREAVRPYQTEAGGLEFPGVTLLAVGRR